MSGWFNEYFILAFIITPAFVVALGWGAVVLHERSVRSGKADR